MDSSPDLSLKLRRGSSDSRDSFYMDFAQGIDSDIEEVATTVSGPVITGGSIGGGGRSGDGGGDRQMDTTLDIDDDDDDGGAGDSPTMPLPPPPPLPRDDG